MGHIKDVCPTSMLDRSLWEDAQFWREIAAEMRTTSELIQDLKCRVIAWRIADEFERLATQTEEHAAQFLFN